MPRLDDAVPPHLDDDRVHRASLPLYLNGRHFRYGRRIPTVTDDPLLEYEAAETLVVSDREQLRALADDLRATIVSLLRERAWSTQQLAQRLDVPKGTVGHHLKVLERAGLIRVVHTRKVRALTEKYYGRVARLFLFEVEEPEDARALGAATMRQVARELAESPDKIGFGFVRARLTPEDAARFERRVKRLLDDFRGSETADGTLVRLAVAVWPTGGPDA